MDEGFFRSVRLQPERPGAYMGGAAGLLLAFAGR